MSDPPLSDIDFKTKMAWNWTTLNISYLASVHTTARSVWKQNALQGFYKRNPSRGHYKRNVLYRGLPNQPWYPPGEEPTRIATPPRTPTPPPVVKPRTPTPEP